MVEGFPALQTVSQFLKTCKRFNTFTHQSGKAIFKDNMRNTIDVEQF